MVVRWLAAAESDLKEIFEYYRSEAGERVARKIVGRIRQAADSLGAMPLMAPVELHLDDRPEGFRSLVVAGMHKVVYFTDGDTVNIAVVWDCRQKPSKLRRSVLSYPANAHENSDISND